MIQNTTMGCYTYKKHKWEKETKQGDVTPYHSHKFNSIADNDYVTCIIVSATYGDSILSECLKNSMTCIVSYSMTA